ncbi:MAG: beta-ketoacyl synthase N-terminal-like domain-containing protein [Candidatus Sumerlaeia bacterium]|nr:beta-ketoacyl synthase N-terminal-like domain-containing protein [Candidatus Sumerlaeia bacterium]
MARPVAVAACAAISPLGAITWSTLKQGARGGLLPALRTGSRALERESLGDGVTVPVARIREPIPALGGDRTIDLLAWCHGELGEELAAAARLATPEERAVFAATSKGAVAARLAGELDWRHAAPDAPARWLAERWPAAGSVQARVAACATGLHNVIAAAQEIADGRARAALAGCAEAALIPIYLATFARLGTLTAGECRPFSAGRDGFALGEGAALFLLIDADFARTLGAAPRLAGWAIAGDPHSMTGMDPTGRAITAAASRALSRAGRRGGGLDLVQCHGTATLANDRAEAAALRVLGAAGAPANSFKGAFGHLTGAASGVELAALLGCMAEGLLPGTAGHGELAEDCAGVTIQREPRDGALSRALKISSGFGGQVGALVVDAAGSSCL